jgi:hypothetical protein
MPYLLRKIRKARWNPDAAKQTDGLSTGEHPADCLADLNSADCCLSFWEIEDGEGNLDDVLVALGSNCDRIANLDYALVNREQIEKVAKLKKTVGQSPHVAANKTWHWDAIGLSTTRLTKVAEIMYETARRVRVTGRQIEKLLHEALQARKLDRGKIKIHLS